MGVALLLSQGALKLTAVITGIADTFSGTYPARSDGSTWSTISGTAPVNSGGKLTPGAAAGTISADLGHQNSTYAVDVNTTVGSFTPIMRLISDGSATTNYVGIALNNSFGISIFSHRGGSFGTVQDSTGAVFSSGVSGRLSVIVSGAPGSPTMTLQFNGTNIPGLVAATGSVVTSLCGDGGTKCGLEMPASAVTFDNYSAT